MKHQQVCIRVNAWVDTGIVGLVSALNGCKDIETLSSCQEDVNEVAYVSFQFNTRTGLDPIACYLQMRRLLSSHLVHTTERDTQYSLDVKWRSSVNNPLFTLSAYLIDLDAVTKAVCEIANHIVKPIK